MVCLHSAALARMLPLQVAASSDLADSLGAAAAGQGVLGWFVLEACLVGYDQGVFSTLTCI